MGINEDDAFVVPYIGTWIETPGGIAKKLLRHVVPYIGTWIETSGRRTLSGHGPVVPYIGTWIETGKATRQKYSSESYLI